MEVTVSTGVTYKAKLMTSHEYRLFSCELCNGNDFAEIPEAKLYTANQPLHVCKGCGFVQVIRRRPSELIAQVWAKELYQTKYTARIPAVKARQVFVAEMIDTTIGLRGKSVCDIGAGEGYFLEMLRDQYGADVFGIEPSTPNCTRMREHKIECFDGTGEQFMQSPEANRRFDVVTIIWTLENANSCRRLMEAAWVLLKDGGHVVLATGSRILVPFKKPLNYYLGPNAADTHAFRFSANALNGLLAETGFEQVNTNRYIDNDILCMIGQRSNKRDRRPWQGDDWRQVLNFFHRWHEDTQLFKSMIDNPATGGSQTPGGGAHKSESGIDRFGKEFEGYRQVKAFFYDIETNKNYLQQQKRTDELYIAQPRRTHCKICSTKLGDVLFTLGKIDFYLCPKCEHLNGGHLDTREFCDTLYSNAEELGVGPKSQYSDDNLTEYFERSRKIYMPKAEYLMDILRQQGEDPLKLRYADLGAGCGHFVAAMLKLGVKNIKGYEISADQVAEGNAKNGSEIMELHGIDDTLRIPATVEADVITSIFQLEHVEDPLGLLEAVARNKNVRYMLLAVPVFSIGLILQACFQNVMPRIIGMGHTHLFSERSIHWMIERFGFKVLSRWWFGSDAFDIHRSINVHLQQDPKLAKLAPVWDRMFLPGIDGMQLLLDELHGSSEIHMVIKVR